MRWPALASVFLLTFGGFAAIDQATIADASAADPVNLGTVETSSSNHVGNAGSFESPNAGTTTGYCIKYSPTQGTWVSSPNEALTAHGYSGSCPTNLETSSQSAIGVTPVSTALNVEPGTTFNIGKIKHYNNPINYSGTSDFFSGTASFRLGGPTGTKLDYDWWLHETPNTGTANQNRDIFKFRSQASTQDIVVDGVTYRLVIKGFVLLSSSTATCPARPDSSATPVNEWLTLEGQTTGACLYASLEAPRELTIKKSVVDGDTNKNFPFTSTSDLAGAPWDGTAFNLKHNETKTATVLSGETVTVTEGSPAVGKWALTDVSCVAGGEPFTSGVSVDKTTGKLTLANIPQPTSADDAAITCTFTNTYKADAKLTLQKSVNSTGQNPVVPTVVDWTLTATNGPNSISGVNGLPAVTSQTVPIGTYTLSEATNNATKTQGYTQEGPWVCKSGNNTVTVTDGKVELKDGDNVTCVVTNKFRSGTLAITKTVTDPFGGFVAASAPPFTAKYVCGALSGTTPLIAGAIGSPGAAHNVTVPAGVSCTVTEVSPPTGSTGLKNSSFEWGSHNVSPSTVTIVAGETKTVNITNPITQNTGDMKLQKVVEARVGTPGSGYTGGTAREFVYDYACTLGGSTVATGTKTVTPAAQVSVTGIPDGASCVITEQPVVEETDDFLDASYSWDGSTSPVTVTIKNGTVAVPSITNYFKRNLVNLTVTKSVDGAGYVGAGSPFEVKYDCGGLDAGTFNLSSTGSKTFQVPANTQCSVAETPPAGNLLSPGYVWGDATYTGLTDGKISVPVGGSGTVAITNHTKIGYGSIAVTKSIPNFKDKVTSGTVFKIAVSCNAKAIGAAVNYSEVFDFIAPGSLTFNTPLLPIGTSCDVTETNAPTGSSQLPNDSYVWGTPPAPQTVKVPASTTPLPVTVINDIKRAYGTFGITKNVVNNTGTPVTQGFSGSWSCTFGGTSSGAGTWSVGASGGAATLTGSPSVLIGSICSVTENKPGNPTTPPDGSYVWTVVSPDTVAVTANGANSTVLNTLNQVTGTFGVAKAVTGGEAGAAFENTDFTFAYTCTPVTGDPVSGTISTKAGASANASAAVPAGSVCTLSETGVANPIDPFRWDGVSFSGGGGTFAGGVYTFTLPMPFQPEPEVPEEGQEPVIPDPVAPDPVSILATNTISQREGSVSVTKTVTQLDGGFTGGTSAIFPVTLTCDGVVIEEKNLANNGTATWSGIPLGKNCVATEGTINGGLKDGSFAWNAPVISAGVKVVEGSTPNITVNNSLKRVSGQIALKKTVNLNDFTGVADPNAEFTGSWTCTYGGDASTKVSGTWSSTADAPGATLVTTSANKEILVGSACSATEDDPGAPSDTDSSYFWATPVITGATASNGSDNVMSVVNKLSRNTVDLEVTKQVTGQTAGFNPGGAFEGFEISAVCTLDGAVGNDIRNTVFVANGATKVLINDVPKGWDCVISEVTPTGNLKDVSFAWGDAVIKVGGETTNTVVMTGDKSAVVQNPITRRTGGLTITKSLGSIPEGVVNEDVVFTGTYECTYGSGENAQVLGGTWKTTGAGEAVLTGPDQFPLTSNCVITEDGLNQDDLTDASYSWNAPVISEDTVISSTETPLGVTVTNSVSRNWAGLQVEKKYDGIEGAFNEDLKVSGAWTCYYGDPELEVAGGTWTAKALGQVVTVAVPGDEKIPATARCVITENTLDPADLTDSSFRWLEPVPATQDVNVTADGQNRAVITNSTERVFGIFGISKEIVPGAGVEIEALDEGLMFSGEYVCSYNSEDFETGTWGPIAAGETWTSSSDTYPLGSTCKILNENQPADPVSSDPSFQWVTPNLGEPVVVSASAETRPVIAVENNVVRLTGNFNVTKGITGDRSGLPTDPMFDFEWACLAPNGDHFPSQAAGQFTIGEAEIWDGPDSIPVGSRCTVTESGIPDPVHPSYAWTTTWQVNEEASETPSSSASFVVEESEEGVQPVLVTAVNDLTRTMGSYTIAKDSDPVSGSTVKPGDVIKYTVTVTPGEAGFVKDVVVVDSLTEVLPHATVTAIVPSQGTASISDDKLTWDVGTVDAGEPLTLTYEATVNAESWGISLKNLVTATGEIPPEECEGTCSTEHFTPHWMIQKSSSVEDGTGVVGGDVITYTLTATNDTEHADVTGAIATDDLTGILENAVLATPLAAGLTNVDGVLTWNLPDMAPGETVEVSYSVSVKFGADGVTLNNGVTPGPGGECPEGECETTHYTPKWLLTKTSDPESGSLVKPGQSITYTLNVENTGPIAVSGAVVSDDLSNVLNNATMIGALPAGATLTDTTLTWNVEDLAVGATSTLDYTVKVHANAIGVTLKNVATPTTPGGQCEENCSTEHSSPAWTISKSSDPVSGSVVASGASITYTLTAKNTGPVALTGATAIDDMSGVLNHASLVGTLDSSLVQNATGLVWTIPTLAPGQSVSVSYTVKVNKTAESITIRNVVTPDASTGGMCEGTCSTTHMTPAPSKPGGLPKTGADGTVLGSMAALAFAAMGGFVLLTRREMRKATQK